MPKNPVRKPLFNSVNFPIAVATLLILSTTAVLIGLRSFKPSEFSGEPPPESKPKILGQVLQATSLPSGPYNSFSYYLSGNTFYQHILKGDTLYERSRQESDEGWPSWTSYLIGQDEPLENIPGQPIGQTYDSFHRYDFGTMEKQYLLKGRTIYRRYRYAGETSWSEWQTGIIGQDQPFVDGLPPGPFDSFNQLQTGDISKQYLLQGSTLYYSYKQGSGSWSSWTPWTVGPGGDPNYVDGLPSGPFDSFFYMQEGNTYRQFLLKESIVYANAKQGSGSWSSWVVYDKDSYWVRLADMPEGLEQHGFEELNGLLYVVGGRSDTDHSNRTYAYDPASNTWSRKADLPPDVVGVQSPVLRAVNGKLYLIGGHNSQIHETFNRTFEYNPATNNWIEKAPMPTIREDMASAVVNEKIYVMGGLYTYPNFIP